MAPFRKSFFVPQQVRSFVALVMVAMLVLVNGCGSGSRLAVEGEKSLQMQGVVMGGQQPVSGARVQLYAAGTTGDQSAATALIGSTVLTDSAGNFNITGDYTCPSASSLVYLTAEGGNPGMGGTVNNTGIVLLEALGACGNLTAATRVVINEATTVGSLYPVAPFANGFKNIGASSTDQSALTADFSTITELIDVTTGRAPGPTPSGSFTVPVSKINTLADAIASCVNSAGGVAGDNSMCGNLYVAATPPGGTAPTNVADAVLNIAGFPYQNVAAIYNLQNSVSPFQPTLSTAPADWVILPLPAITLAPDTAPVGIGASATGTVTLAQPAPAGGLTVTLTSSNTSVLTVASTVTFAGGQTGGTFTYNGVAAGTATISAVASNYAQGTLSVTPTNALLVVGDPGTLAPGQTATVPVSLSAISASPTTVTLSLQNSSPKGVLTLNTSSVTIAAGSLTPPTQPTVTVNGIGTATFVASSTSYAAASRALTSTLTASLPSSVTLPVGNTNETLSLSGPAPAGGLTFTLASSNTAVATVPASVTVAQGSTSAVFAVSALTTGTTTITATSTGVNTPSMSVTVASSITANAGTVGIHTQGTTSAYLNVAPQSPVTVTITSNNPAVAILSKDGNTVGSASLTFTNVTTTNGLYFVVQGESVGSTTYTVTATGYSTTTGTLAVWPTGFAVVGGNFTTTTYSSPVNELIYMYVLDPNNLSPQFQQGLAPDASPLNVTMNSSSTAIGTVSTPAVLTTGQTSASYTFTPVGPGSSTITATPPASYSTPSNTASITATVVPPGVNAGDQETGLNVQTGQSVSLRQTPPSAVNVTVALADPTIAVLSTDSTVMGTGGTLTFTGVTSTNNLSYYLQGKKKGTTTLTVSAPGYTSQTVNITVFDAGFTMAFGDFGTTTFSSPSQFGLELSTLNADLSLRGNAYLNPDQLPLSVAISNSNSSVGTVDAPYSFPAGTYYYFSGKFTPANAGSTTLTIVQPTGFSTPSSRSSVTATVTAPAISDPGGTTAVHAEVQDNVYLTQTPPAGVTMTVTLSDPTVALLSTDPNVMGSGTLTFTNVADTGGRGFWVQGLKEGSTTMTVTAPGFATRTTTITTWPTGFYLSGSFTTTAYSPTSQIQVAFVALAPGGHNPQFFPRMNPDSTPISVTLTSSDPTVGTITSPVSVDNANNPAYATFTPKGIGSTTLTVTTPPGYTASSYQASITANVVAPGFASFSDMGTGHNGEGQTYFSLGAVPPAPVTVTMTIANPSVAILSTNGTVTGSGTITFTNVTDQSRLYFYLQGVAEGQTTATVSAPGFQSQTVNVTVQPSGFFFSGSINAAAGSSNVQEYVQLYAENSGGGIQYPVTVAPFAPMPITFRTSDAGVGNLAPLTIGASNQSGYATFNAGHAGTATITIVQPAGFMAPLNDQTTTATVQ